MTQSDQLTQDLAILVKIDVAYYNAIVSQIKIVFPEWDAAMQSCSGTESVWTLYLQSIQYWNDVTSQDGWEQTIMDNYNLNKNIITAYNSNMVSEWNVADYFTSGMAGGLAGEQVIPSLYSMGWF